MRESWPARVILFRVLSPQNGTVLHTLQLGSAAPRSQNKSTLPMESYILNVNISTHAANCSSYFEMMANKSITTHQGRRLKGLVRAALTSLLVLPVTSLAQAEPSALKEREPPVEVCTGKMVDGSGTDFVNAMAFTPDGRHLLLGCRSGAVELRTPEGQLRFSQQTKLLHVESVAVTPDGRHLFSLIGDTIHRWSESGEARGSFSAAIC